MMKADAPGFPRQIFDPYGTRVLHWNHLILWVSVFNFFLDPSFVYLSTVSNFDEGLITDFRTGVVLAMVRSAGDCLLIIGIIVKFCTAYEAPGCKIFKTRKMITDPKDVAIKYLRSTFVMDLVAMLPLPQVYLWYLKIASRTSGKSNIEVFDNFYYIYIVQYFPRMLVIFNTRRQVTKSAGSISSTPWSGAFYNLLCYIIVSNLAGALYYQMHVEFLISCKERVKENKIHVASLDWDQFLSNCTSIGHFKDGMLENSLTNRISSRTFIQKFMYCFSWGLKSFSSLGQNFSTNYSTLETTFSISINLVGLVLLADMITRMQASIQSMEEKEEQQRERQREIKEWMDYHQLPLELKERVDHAIQSEWSKNGINDEDMLDSLPMDLRVEIRRYLYIDLISKLPKFADMDNQLAEAICQHVRTFSSRESTYMVYEGDLLREMLFIFSGQLEISFRDSGSSSSMILGPGDICGQELVTWASLSTTSLQSLPSSTWTMKCLTDVEAFSLQAYDLKMLATRFAHNQEFQRAFKQHYP